MEPNRFDATAWNNGDWRESGAGYGLNVSAEDRDTYFHTDWNTVTLRPVGDRTSRVAVEGLLRRETRMPGLHRGDHVVHGPVLERVHGRGQSMVEVAKLGIVDSARPISLPSAVVPAPPGADPAAAAFRSANGRCKHRHALTSGSRLRRFRSSALALSRTD